MVSCGQAFFRSLVFNWVKEDQNKTFEKLQIDSNVLDQLAQLTKANSIKANKLNNVTIIYTPVDNLHTDGSMDVGTVTFHNPQKSNPTLLQSYTMQSHKD